MTERVIAKLSYERRAAAKLCKCASDICGSAADLGRKSCDLAEFAACFIGDKINECLAYGNKLFILQDILPPFL